MRSEILDKRFIFGRSSGLGVSFVQMSGNLLNSPSVDEIFIRQPCSMSDVLILSSECLNGPSLVVISGGDGHVGMLSNSIAIAVVPTAILNLFTIFLFQILVPLVNKFACGFARELGIDV